MWTWLTDNLGTIAVALALAAWLAAVIAGLRRERVRGGCSCGGNCGACGACSACGHCGGERGERQSR